MRQRRNWLFLPKSPDSNVKEVLLMTPDSLLVLITENNAQASTFSVTSVKALPILLVGS
jgi:hypothetical protein